MKRYLILMLLLGLLLDRLPEADAAGAAAHCGDN